MSLSLNTSPTTRGLVSSCWLGTKSEVAATPLPSQGPTRGRTCYVTPAFSGVPRQGDKIRSGCLTSTFSGGHKRAEVLRNPCILGGPQTRGQNQKWLPHTLPSRGATRERKCYVTPAVSGVPKQGDKIGSGCLTLCLLGGQDQKWCLKKSIGRATKKASLVFF